jgi:hypothetical protein
MDLAKELRTTSRRTGVNIERYSEMLFNAANELDRLNRLVALYRDLTANMGTSKRRIFTLDEVGLYRKIKAMEAER